MLKSLIESIREAVLKPWTTRPPQAVLDKIATKLRADGLTTKKYKKGDPKAVIRTSGKSPDDEAPSTKPYTWRDAGKEKKFGS